MLLTLKNGALGEGWTEQDGGDCLAVLSMDHLEELRQIAPDFVERVQGIQGERQSQMEGQGGAVFAALHPPDGQPEHGLYFWLNPRQLFMVCPQAQALSALLLSQREKNAGKWTLPLCAQRLLGGLAQQRAAELETLEQQLGDLEDQVLDADALEDFPKQIAPVRRQLMHLHTYFERLVDLAQLLTENGSDLFPHDSQAPFRHLTSGFKHLSTSAQTLREYAMQVQEIYQSQVDIQQNKIMRILTVITTIFMPLSLITSWYGMNFVGMPALEWEYGYRMVILISIVVLGLTIWYFKRKKYL